MNHPTMPVALCVMLFSAIGLGRETEPASQTEIPAKAPVAADQPAATEPAKGDEKKPADSNATEPTTATSEQLGQWIKDLGHQKFAMRQAASQKLVQAGVPGMEAAATAAKTEDLELATRCLAVLTEGLNSKHKEIHKAARSALEALTTSENKSVAQRARQALDTPQELPELPGNARKSTVRNVRQIHVQVVNGTREISIQENGKLTVIKDTNGKDVSVSITETVNGQKVTQTFAGKDEADLQKNHPEAHKVYSRFTRVNANGGFQIQIGGNRFGGNPVAPAPPRNILNPARVAELFEEMDQLRQKLEVMNERLEKAAHAAKPDSNELQEIADEMKAAVKRLREIKTESQLP